MLHRVGLRLGAALPYSARVDMLPSTYAGIEVCALLSAILVYFLTIIIVVAVVYQSMLILNIALLAFSAPTLLVEWQQRYLANKKTT